jgi:hypothetical protein
LYCDGSWQEHAVPAALAGSPHLRDTDKKVHSIVLRHTSLLKIVQGEPGRNSSVIHVISLSTPPPPPPQTEIVSLVRMLVLKQRTMDNR